jgi:integrase
MNRTPARKPKPNGNGRWHHGEGQSQWSRASRDLPARPSDLDSDAGSSGSHKCLAYAIRKKRLSTNPLAKGNLPEGRTSPEKPSMAVDPRSIGGHALLRHMLSACDGVGARQGRRFKAFYACMFYGMMGPSEVAALNISGCDFPRRGWGRLSFTDASPSAGRAYTDDGQVHENRGLKGRTKGRPGPRARRPVRSVPVSPTLVRMLREHVEHFGTAPDGRIFRSEQGNLVPASTWWQCGPKSGPHLSPPDSWPRR